MKALGDLIGVDNLGSRSLFNQVVSYVTLKGSMYWYIRAISVAALSIGIATKFSNDLLRHFLSVALWKKRQVLPVSVSVSLFLIFKSSL